MANVPGYTANTFTAGEQPSVSVWNELWSNDAAFNTALTTGYPYNPYSFSAYNSSATTIAANGAATKIAFQTKTFDTGANFDSTNNYRFIAPVSGKFTFSASVNAYISNGVLLKSYLYLNGVSAREGSSGMNSTGGANNIGSVVEGTMELASGDYVEVWATSSQVSGATTNASSSQTYFDGHLVSLA